LVAVVVAGTPAHGVRVKVNGEAQKLFETRFHTTISKFCPFGTSNWYEVAPFVERPISAMRLAQTLLGLKLPRYAALANPVEPEQVVVRLTVKQSGDAPPVSLVKTYDKYLKVPVAAVPQDGPWPHTVFPTPSSSMRVEVAMPVAMS
jgi:hypothetical protein